MFQAVDWWSQWNIMPILSDQLRVTMTHMMVGPRGVAVERSELPWISFWGTLFHVMITRTGTDLMFLSLLGSTICFTNFGSHDPIVLFWIQCYMEQWYKESLLYIHSVGVMTLLATNTWKWGPCRAPHQWKVFFYMFWDMNLNLVYTSGRWCDISSLNFIAMRSLWPSLQPKIGQIHFLHMASSIIWILQIWHFWPLLILLWLGNFLP